MGKLEKRVPDGFLSIEDTAEMLGYTSTDSVYRLVRRGELRKYSVLDTPMFKKEDVKALLRPVAA